MNDSPPPPEPPAPLPGEHSEGRGRRWRTAPKISRARNTVQFRLITLFIIVTVSGPILALAMQLPQEFYKVNMVVIAAVGSCVVISFLLSFLRWTWVTACLILAVIFTLASFLGLATGEINFSPSNKAALCVTAIAATITGACGLLLSIARHQQ